MWAYLDAEGLDHDLVDVHELHACLRLPGPAALGYTVTLSLSQSSKGGNAGPTYREGAERQAHVRVEHTFLAEERGGRERPHLHITHWAGVCRVIERGRHRLALPLREAQAPQLLIHLPQGKRRYFEARACV